MTVRNGQIVGVGAMFSASGASRNRLLDVDGTAAGTAVTFVGGADNEVRRGEHLRPVARGVQSQGSQRFVLADSELDGFFTGGLVHTGDDARMVRNRFARATHDLPDSARAGPHGNARDDRRQRRRPARGPAARSWSPGPAIA